MQEARDEQQLGKGGIFFFARDPRNGVTWGLFWCCTVAKKGFKQQTTNTTRLTQTNRWVRPNWIELIYWAEFTFYFLVAKKASL